MPKIHKIILLIESSRASGRALLEGIARYVHDHGPWSFYWEPGGLEKGWPKLKSLDLQRMIVRDVGNLEEALAFGIPTVVVGHRRAEVAGLVNVVTDSTRIGRMGAGIFWPAGSSTLRSVVSKRRRWNLPVGPNSAMPGLLNGFMRRALRAGPSPNSDIVRVTLSNPTNGQLSGASRVYYVRSLNGTADPPVLAWARFPDETLLYWSDATAGLIGSTSLSGPWPAVTNAISPFAVVPVAPKQFYRLKR